MTLLVPEKVIGAKAGASFPDQSDLLASAVEFIGASAGWIGLRDAGGAWSFPVCGGAFAESWLHWLPARGSVWGFAVAGEPALLNDLQAWMKLGDPPLRNLLSCPLVYNDQLLGHIALANKAHGFAAADAVVLQGLAHHMTRLLARRPAPPTAAIDLSAAWRRILDRAAESILILDESGTLIYVSATWLDWTGFRAEELLGRTAPFPFWVSQQDLVRALSAAPDVPASALPFRRRDLSLFWCQIETATQRWDDRVVTVAFLQRTPALSPASSAVEPAGGAIEAEQPPRIGRAGPDWLPLLLDLDGVIDGWGPRWQERTGLSAADVQGSRSELVLDWLFPRQHDRDCVADCFHRPTSAGCQFLLDIATHNGSRSALCTFLPWATGESAAVARRWLLLVGEVEPLSDPSSRAAAHKETIRLDPSSTARGPHPHSECASVPPIVPPET